VNIYSADRVRGSYYPYPTRPVDIPRDDTLLKNESSPLEREREKEPRPASTILAWRDELTWARIPVLATVHTCISRTFHPKQHIQVFQATIVAHKSHEYKIKLKQAKIQYKHVNPSFPYLDKG